MSTRLSAGAAVQTPFGKGTVREVRKNGRVVVEVFGRALVLRETEVSAVEQSKRRGRPAAAVPDGPPPAVSGPNPARGVATEVDLHGLTVDEALAAAGRAVNDALLAEAPELRFIHGKSGGRVRGALHRWLRRISSVRSFRLDPRNEGVTIVQL